LKIKLSVLDQSPISEGSSANDAFAQTARLAQETEKLGYHRFWVSEHHFSNSLAGSSPEVLITHLAARTSKLRIGSGGVMLPHYSPYKVAENFRVLEALYPGRIDLGVGRAPGGLPLVKQALQEGKEPGGDRYPEQLDDLIGYLHDSLNEDHPYGGLLATPVVPSAPDIWLLGSGREGARIAALKGAAFAFAQFINGEEKIGIEAMQAYRRNFQPSKLGDKPRSLVAVFAVCAETEEQAQMISTSFDLSTLMALQGIRPEGVPSIEKAQNYAYSAYDTYLIRQNRKRMIVGTKEQIKQKILDLSEAYETDEFMIVTVTYRFEDKLNSYRLLADTFGLYD
jgi:luciferase family oxidoreductase group 1